MILNEECGLSDRAVRLLVGDGILTVEMLVDAVRNGGAWRLLRIRGLGRVVSEECVKFVVNYLVISEANQREKDSNPIKCPDELTREKVWEVLAEYAFDVASANGILFTDEQYIYTACDQFEAYLKATQDKCQ